MNEIINKFLLAEEKFLSDMHLKQLEFTYSACDSFTKNNKRTKKIKKKQEIGDILIKMNYIKLVFNMIWLIADFKDLNRRKASDKVLCYKAFNIAENPKYDGYQWGLASEVYKFFDKKLLVEQLKMKLFLIKN